MDLETENRIATMLLREAAELRRQAEKDGVQAYLRRPTVRGRPNSRFLTATVLGVQQANRTVEVNEMWRARQKELEMDTGSRHRSETHRRKESHDVDCNYGKMRRPDDDFCSSSSYIPNQQTNEESEGLKDAEVEEFLHSRVKRGRGAVGSRMDETGPYLASHPDFVDTLSASHTAKRRTILGPTKPSCDKSNEEEHLRRKKKSSSSKKHSKKHKSKVKSKGKEKH